MYLENKVALITGASKGIGKTLAFDLAAEKAKVVLIARSEKELQEISAEIKQKGGDCLFFVGNVSDESFVEQIISETLTHFGQIDFMINNAGFGIFKRAEEITSAEWDEIYETNVKGTFLFSKAVLPFMKEKQAGHIINIASDVAKRVFDGGSLYCSSKYAQDAFSMALRKEVREYGIKVSVVYSGVVDTMFHKEPQGHPKHAKYLKPEDMSRSILFLMNQPPHVVIDELMIHPLSQIY